MGTLPSVETWDQNRIPVDLLRDCLQLTGTIWPGKESLEERLEKALANRNDTPDAMWHIVRRDNIVIAVSRSFPRIIADASGHRFTILALASVCTHPGHRHAGLGRSVVQAAWSRLNSKWPVCFFQTGVPPFYEKQGARLIHSLIHNGTEGATAFWDPHAMIYPATAPWPEGPIDLLGPGW